MNDPNYTSPWPIAIPPANPESRRRVLDNSNGVPMPYQNLYPQQVEPYGAGFSMFPFYGYDCTESADRDVTYMKQLYPMAVQKIQAYVEDECDKLEYDGSCMFDDCPDHVHLSVIVNIIYDKVKDTDFSNSELKAEDLSNPQRSCYGDNCGNPPPRPPRPCGPGYNCPPPRSDYHPDGRPNWKRNLIEILLYNEMNERRRRHRRRKRWF